MGEIDSKGAKKYLCGHFGYIKYANVKNLTEEIFEIWMKSGISQKVEDNTNRVNRGRQL